MRKIALLICAMVASCLYAQDTRLVIDNQTPGWLSSLLTYSQQKTVEELTITGYINKTDMDFVNNLIKDQKLMIIDISNSILISPQNDENYIWSGFLDFGKEKELQKLRMPKRIEGVIWNVYGSDYTPIIKSHVDTLEMGYEDMGIFTKFQDYRDGESICKYPPKHLILLEGVKIIPDNCFTYSAGAVNPKPTCMVTLANSTTHIGGRAFDASFMFEDFTFPDSIRYLGKSPIMNITANYSDVHGLASENCWAYNSTFSISKDKIEFPKNLRFYNSLHYVVSSLKGYDVVTYDKYDSDTIIVGAVCDTLYAKLNAKIGYFYNENPVKSWSYEDFCIDTLYVPEGSLAKYLDEYNYSEALRLESGQQIKAIKEMKKVRSIEILSKNLTCMVGEEIKMQASISPVDAFNKSFTWKTSDSDIATVDQKGLLSAKKAGEAWIVVISNENSAIQDSCKITVIQPVTGVTLSHDSYIFDKAGETIQLEATVLPNDASNKSVNWSSTNSQVCIVTNGLVTAIGAGTASVTVSTLDGNFSASCLIKVVQHATKVELNKSATSLKVGETEQLAATVLPYDAENKTLSWYSTNDQIATVDASGSVKALKAGEAWIKAVSEDNAQAKDSCLVTVIQPVTGVTLSQNSYRLTNIGENIQLEATVQPEDASNKEVKWSSSDESVCIVANGKVVATGFGTAVVMAVTVDGGFMATCAIVVEKETIPVTDVTLSQTQALLIEGERLQLTATVKPNDATNKNLIWKSSDETICVVTQAGLLIAMTEGEAIVTMIPENGVGQAQCNVTVISKENAAIEDVIGDGRSSVPVYDMMGCKVTHLVKGRLYIRNGQKFIAQ